MDAALPILDEALPIFGVFGGTRGASKVLARGFHLISRRLAEIRECSRAFYTLSAPCPNS